MNLGSLSLLLLSLLSELVIAIILYFLQLFFFINKNRDFYQNCSDKLLKIIKLIY